MDAYFTPSWIYFPKTIVTKLQIIILDGKSPRKLVAGGSARFTKGSTSWPRNRSHSSWSQPNSRSRFWRWRWPYWRNYKVAGSNSHLSNILKKLKFIQNYFLKVRLYYEVRLREKSYFAWDSLVYTWHLKNIINLGWKAAVRKKSCFPTKNPNSC